jgi:hypothetical protein
MDRGEGSLINPCEHGGLPRQHLLCVYGPKMKIQSIWMGGCRGLVAAIARNGEEATMQDECGVSLAVEPSLAAVDAIVPKIHKLA